DRNLVHDGEREQRDRAVVVDFDVGTLLRYGNRVVALATDNVDDAAVKNGDGAHRTIFQCLDAQAGLASRTHLGCSGWWVSGRRPGGNGLARRVGNSEKRVRRGQLGASDAGWWAGALSGAVVIALHGCYRLARWAALRRVSVWQTARDCMQSAQAA